MNRDPKWLVFALLGLVTLFVGSTFNTWMISAVTFAFFSALVLFFRRRLSSHRLEQIPRSLRRCGFFGLFFLIAFITTAWRYTDYAAETINPIAFGFDAFSHAAMVWCLVLWVKNRKGGHPAMLGLGLVVVLLCIAAGGASQSFAAQVTVALAAITGFAFAADSILGYRRIQSLTVPSETGSLPRSRIRESDSRLRDSGRVGLLFSLLVLSGILMMTSAIAHGTWLLLPNIQKKLHDELSSSLDALRNQSLLGSARYVRGSRIGAIRRHMLANPQEVALRVHASSTPGYLRGTVFDAYSRGRWSAVSNDRLAIQMESKSIDSRSILPSGRGLMRLQGRSERMLKRFFLHTPSNEKIAAVEIHNDPTKGSVVFTPLSTRWVEAASQSISVSHHDIVQGGVDIRSPYVCGVARNTVTEPMDPVRRQFVTQLPAGSRSMLIQLAESLCVDRPTAPAKAKAISKYFQENFEYSLVSEVPRTRGDPIVQFLSLKHPAHCEFFATATVLLLRGAGVPARYVTGYVAAEYSDEESHWVARNRDAHAWAEAYDEITGHWFPVESTPGRSYQSMSMAGADADSLNGQLDSEDDDASDSHSWVSMVWGWLTSMRATDPLFFVFRIAQLPLFCVLVFLLWKHLSGHSSNLVNPVDMKSKKMLRHVDRKLSKLSLIRAPHETLHQFAQRIEHATSQSQQISSRHRSLAQHAAAWYRDYAAARYRGQLPRPFDVVAA